MQIVASILAAVGIAAAADVAASAFDVSADSFDVALSMHQELADASVLGLQRSVTLIRGSAGAVAKAVPRTTPMRSKDGVSFADVSVLGLQRSVKLVKGTAVAAQDDALTHRGAASISDVSVQGRQHSVNFVKGATPVVGDVAPAGRVAPSFADVSVLGLQRSVKVVKGSAEPLQEDDSAPSIQQSVDAPRRSTTGPSFGQVSVLGLQRSVRVVKVPPLSQEADEADDASIGPTVPRTDASPKRATDTQRHPDVASRRSGTAPSFADVSVLGLQRSTKLVKTRPISEEPLDGIGEAGITSTGPSLAAVSVLGFQRSAVLRPGVARATTEASQQDVAPPAVSLRATASRQG